LHSKIWIAEQNQTKLVYNRLRFIMTHWSKRILYEISGKTVWSELSEHVVVIVFVPFLAFLSE